MNIIERLRKVKLNKKGFTLVELIVVLVILAILLAILVPSLIGWIGRARDREVLVNARTVYLAAQTVLTENEITDISDFTVAHDAEIVELAGIRDGVTYVYTITSLDGKGSITGMTYEEGAKSIELKDSIWGSVVHTP